MIYVSRVPLFQFLQDYEIKIRDKTKGRGDMGQYDFFQSKNVHTIYFFEKYLSTSHLKIVRFNTLLIKLKIMFLDLLCVV